MELTQSAFNVLLDMTSLRGMVNDELSRLGSASHKMTQREEKSEKPQTVEAPDETPRVYYYDGEQRSHFTRGELLSRIQAQPQGQHFVWVPRLSAWKSWRSIPNLVQAVIEVDPGMRGQLTSPQAQMTPAREIQAPTRVETVREVKVDTRPQATIADGQAQATHKSAFWPLKPIEVIAQRESDYLSIPETIFTHFSLELNNPHQLTPYVGWDGTLLSGGLFINTPRALNVGDYIQISITHRDHEVLSFEAPVRWLRLPQGSDDHFGGGVGVEWPESLTTAQLRIFESGITSEEFDFFEV
jgi:Tfp pilus assembly protein PilZ